MRNSNKRTSVWIVSLRSPLVFSHRPDDDELEEILRKHAPGEWDGDDGPGFRGSYIHVGKPRLYPIRGHV